MLHRRTSAPMLEMSAYLAKLANNKGLLQAVKVKLSKLTGTLLHNITEILTFKITI